MSGPRSIASKARDPVEFAKDGVGDHVSRPIRKTRHRPRNHAVAPHRREDTDEKLGIKFGLLDKDRDGGTQYVKIELPDNVRRRLRIRNRSTVIYRIS